MTKKLLNRKRINPAVPTYTGIKNTDPTSAQYFKYNSEECFETSIYNIANFNGIAADHNTYWINIHGLHEVEKIRSVCSKLKVHDIVVQDILDVNQRPKFQEFENHWFFSIKSGIPGQIELIDQEQLSFILGSNFLISFQERKADYFEHIRQRIREKIGIVRDRGTDYLLFLLLESIMDNYSLTMSTIEKQLESISLTDQTTDISPKILKELEVYRRQIHRIKKTIVPVKDFLIKIEREKDSFIQEKHIKYFLELKDICYTLIDDCDHIEIKIESNVNLFFSIQGHRMNQVMKTLTVVATIFIPLTFIAGIYGMNFTSMPELEWEWGYVGVWAIMIVVVIGMVTYLKRKNLY